MRRDGAQRARSWLPHPAAPGNPRDDGVPFRDSHDRARVARFASAATLGTYRGVADDRACRSEHRHSSAPAYRSNQAASSAVDRAHRSRANPLGTHASTRRATFAARAPAAARARPAPAAGTLSAPGGAGDLSVDPPLRLVAAERRRRRALELLELLVDRASPGGGAESLPDPAALRPLRCAALFAHPQPLQRAGQHPAPAAVRADPRLGNVREQPGYITCAVYTAGYE